MKCCKSKKNEWVTEWYDSARKLPSDWDENLPRGHFLLSESLKTNEATGLPDVECRFALQRHNGVVKAQAAFQILSIQKEHVNPTAIGRWQYAAWTAFIKTATPKLLVGGQLFRHDVCTIHYDRSVDAYAGYLWYHQAIKTVMRESCAAAALIKDPPEELAPLFLHHAPEFLLLRNDISMQMEIPSSWKTITDYEKSLKHKYAQRFRKLRQSWSSLEIRELDAKAVNATSSEIYSLYRQVTNHQPVRLGFLSREFLPVLKLYYGDQLGVWGIYEKNVMVAFVSAWIHRDSFDMFYIGFDYERNADLNLYFNILFFSIEQAIRFQKPLLILGRTALEAKARVGCKPTYLNTYLYIRNPLLRRIVAFLQNRLGESGNEWEQRHPFKPGH